MASKITATLCFIISLWTGSFAIGDANLQRLTTILSAKNRLNFGDTCKYESEQVRLNSTKAYSNMVMGLFGGGDDPKNMGVGGLLSGIGSAGGFDVNKMGNHFKGGFEQGGGFMKAVQAVADLTGNLCNSSQNLACLSSGTCGCAEEDWSLGYLASFERINDKCVLKGGSICIPKELADDSDKNNPGPFRSAASAIEAAMCPNPNKCFMKDTTDACNKANVELKTKAKLAELEKSGKPRDADTYVAAMLEALRPGACVCAGTNFLASMFTIALSSMAVINFL